MLNRLRPQLKLFIDPIAKRIKINPNILTIIGLLISLLAAYMFARGDLLLGGIFILVSGLADVIDGAVARNHATTTSFGGILDSTADRFADAFILIGIIYGGSVSWLIGILALHASLSVSYVRARIEVEGISGSVGIAERAERLVILVIGAFLSVIMGSNYFLALAVILIMVLGYFTVLQRVYHAWKQLKPDK
ncbi:archaetidylinositol phosphate synthase [Methanobacterium sp.]|uniref:archaetidylinositol phosphate synthase n=1 Tax=Methanobacterium sp. TaxID=2164 RepID=UPI003C72FBF5